MNTLVENICAWPVVPPIPDSGEFALVRVPTSAKRTEARQQLRNALREILAQWSGLEAGLLPLRETLTGPVWPGLMRGHPLDISLSYIECEGWIALRLGGCIGLDVMRPAEFSEMDELARNLGGGGVLDADDRPLSFAKLWTGHEAKVKCAKAGIGADLALPFQVQIVALQSRVVVAVAVPL